MAQTKEQHARDIQGFSTEITTLKEEMQQLKRHRSANIVLSSPSLPHDLDSEDTNDDLGDSPKQGRKLDTWTKGRKLDFEGAQKFEGFEGFENLGNDEPVEEDRGTEEVPQQQFETE